MQTTKKNKLIWMLSGILFFFITTLWITLSLQKTQAAPSITAQEKIVQDVVANWIAFQKLSTASQKIYVAAPAAAIATTAKGETVVVVGNSKDQVSNWSDNVQKSSTFDSVANQLVSIASKENQAPIKTATSATCNNGAGVYLDTKPTPPNETGWKTQGIPPSTFTPPPPPPSTFTPPPPPPTTYTHYSTGNWNSCTGSWTTWNTFTHCRTYSASQSRSVSAYTDYSCCNEAAPSNTQDCSYLECDSVSPSCSAILSSNNWVNQDLTSTATCSDSGSPTSGCTQSQQFQTLVNHNTTASFAFTDNAGNQTTCSSTASKIDRLSPNCNLNMSPPEWTEGTVTITANCSDQAATINSGMSECQQNTLTEVLSESRAVNMIVKDKAGNQTTCSTIVPKIHYVEVRGLQKNQTQPSLKNDFLNQIRQNVADLTRNEQSNTNHNALNFNLKNGNIAYYEGDVALDAISFNGKKTIIVKNGDLYLKDNITPAAGVPTSILGIIVLKGSDGSKGNVYLDANTTDIHAVLVAEWSVFSVNWNTNVQINNRDNVLINQLYWKGSLISNNTNGWYKKWVDTLEHDLKYFRSYHPETIWAKKSHDPKNSNAPMIIEYDASLQNNVPYGFEQPNNVNFQQIIN